MKENKVQTNKKSKKPKTTSDPFYAKSNIRYLENIMNNIKKGKAHFSEHELIEEK